MTGTWTSKPVRDEPPEDRIDTPHGTICVAPMSETTVRVCSGKDVGWFRHEGRSLYATALFRREEGTVTWGLHPVHSAVTHVVDGKAGERVAPDLRDAAYAVLKETFDAWLAERPHTMAVVALASRAREEQVAEQEVRDLQERLDAARRRLPRLRRAREAAEAEVERLAEGPSPAPAP